MCFFPLIMSNKCNTGGLQTISVSLIETNKRLEPWAQNFTYITDEGTGDHGTIVAVN